MKKAKSKLVVLTAIIFIATTLVSCSGSSTGTDTTAVTTTSVTTAPDSVADVTDVPVEQVELYVSAAASLTESMNKILEIYKEEHPEVTLIYNFGSSGTLQTQIQEGADADIFISAAQKQMNTLDDAKLLLEGTRIDLLENKVVLIVPKGSKLGLASFEDTINDKVSLIAIGDPASVPVGQYAQEIFTYLKAWDKITAKANLGSDVKAVLSWVETGNVDCGVVYATDAATNDGVTVVCEAPEGSHSPVVYPAAVVGASKNAEAAKEFLDFLNTGKATEVFAANGFSTVD